ncbi:wos2 protein [Moniliophthora roreri MCA 2997]|uniref:Wos2 protein n=1 Tax=Moniliophthora roreri (strain MCA 2997) TaxID=1381753 RepID=V2WQ16_MONRO|nr:wos2 protein [Moniliophthora roreri MCA 2997]
MPQHPEVLWAQRSNKTDAAKNIIYLTVNLPDIQDSTLQYNLTPTTISFKARAGDASKGIEEKDYEFDLELFSEVIPEESSKRLNSRSLNLVLRKKELNEEYWPRLTKAKVKNAFIKTDFSKWVDEDEQEGEPLPDDDFDVGGMGGMGGMPGMGGMGGLGGDMDFEKMMAQMGGGAGAEGSSGGADEEDDDSDDDGPPPLEEAEPPK